MSPDAIAAPPLACFHFNPIYHTIQLGLVWSEYKRVSERCQATKFESSRDTFLKTRHGLKKTND